MNNNERGLTLVEVLAVIVIGSIVSVIATQVIVSSFKTYDRVHTETELRDEADYIMGSMIRDFYVTKTSDVKKKDLEGPNYYFELKNGVKLGFADGSAFSKEGEIHSRDEAVQLVMDTDIHQGTRITEIGDEQYEITLVLEKDEHALEVRSVVDLIIVPESTANGVNSE